MTTEVTIKLYGDVEKSVWMWCNVTGCTIEDLLGTIVYDQTARWEKSLPKSIRELRDERGVSPGI